VKITYISPSHQGGGLPLVGSSRLIIRYILSYRPYLEVVSPHHKSRTRHVVAERAHLQKCMKKFSPKTWREALEKFEGRWQKVFKYIFKTGSVKMRAEFI